MQRIGVFICHCGINIASTVDVEEVVSHAQQLPEVVTAEHYIYMCSEPGQNMIREQIKTHNLNKVVVASCSPTMHEITFREVVKDAGINPFCFEMANIREQCSWVHPDKRLSTEKAKAILTAAVSRVSLLEPLKEKTVTVTPSVLVVGAGIAGMQASLDIANAGYKVHLVEKEPSIGGRMAQLDKTFPTLDCAACTLTPKMVDVKRNPNIKLHTYSEIEEISGYVGNFKVKIKKKISAVDEEKCTGCGDCWNNCLVRNRPEIHEVPSIAPVLEKEMLTKLNKILRRYKGQTGVEIPILQDINIEFNYLPKEALIYVAERLETPVSRIFEMATFFNAFSLEPRGKHTVSVCMGTACHVQGGERILERLEGDLNIKKGETTEDLKFSLEIVRCLGCCGLAPVVTIGDDLYGKVTQSRLSKILKKYRN